MRLNRLMFMRAMGPMGYVHQDLGTAINGRGRLGQQTELVVFGGWLFAGMPGRGSHPGRAPDPRRLLKVTAASLAALEAQLRAHKDSKAAKATIKTSDIVRLWKRLFDLSTRTSDHTASLRSLRSVIPDYMAHLNAGELYFNRQKVTGSPLMTELAKALSPSILSPVKSLPSLPLSTVPGAAPKDFEILLVYSSPEAEAEYRNLKLAGTPPRALRYEIMPVSPTSANNVLRADRDGRLLLRPDFDVKRMLTVKALIDRIAFTVDTKTLTSVKALRAEIDRRCDLNLYVADQTIVKRGDEWWVSLPKLDIGKVTGQHFVIMLQEPTPATLRAVLTTIDDASGIEGDVRPFLIELAVDFYPRSSTDPVDSLLTREQIVGLLHRHHWASSSRLLGIDPEIPRQFDPRQLYASEVGRVTRYLFAGTSRFLSDSAFQDQPTRQRILTAKAGNDLYLNSTLYRGQRYAQLQTNVQHKVTDEWNEARKTKVSLPNSERRGRAEVTLTSFGTVEQFELKRIEDLANISFRKMTRELMRFRLATCTPDPAAVAAAIAQMKTRGIYGVEMNQRAAMLDARMRTRPRPRSTDRDGYGLVDWPAMNEVVGAALDRLSARWRLF
ncbi:hypothetical protein UM399_04330 [Sulfitobacter pontiacus]|uniref:hypothetical protein n=1 Tax=Sulfitobacter pontiacus TaxID=60137 RepID=UPI002AC9CC18|nr:hypothetical protein [Sulfitobacter pontiacus]WPZ26231.1 hypothetical protein UM399_04330 [Sulfitobacter pontiacus]